MFSGLFRSITSEEKEAAVKQLISHSTPGADFYFLMVLSVIVATFGFFMDSPAVIIGSMLIAPILLPIVSLALGIVLSDGKLISRSFFAVVRGGALSVLIAAVVTFLFYSPNLGDASSLISSRLILPYLIVAIAGGLAVAYAIFRPALNELLPGAAIAVALIPPLAAIGMGVAQGDASTARTAFIIFCLNVFGIVAASVVVFSLMKLYTARDTAIKTVDEEERRLINQQHR